MGSVSIIVAAYNIENYIGRCLESLINQTFKDIEIIVVNDGSTDSTLTQLNKYLIQDKRIKVISKQNEGLIEARKTGYNYAKNKYVLFVDGDDYLEITAIEKLYNCAENNNVDLVYYKYKYAYDTGETIESSINLDNIQCLNNNLLHLILVCKIPANIVCLFIKKDFITKNRIIFPSNISYGEDLAICSSIAMNQPSITFLNEPLYYYYQRSESISNNISDKVLEIITALDYIKEQLIKKNLYQENIEEYNFLVYLHNYNYRTSIIYKNKNIYKKLYQSWKEKKINIYKNKYYQEIMKNKTNKQRLLITLMERNYYIFLLYSKIYTVNNQYAYKAKW